MNITIQIIGPGGNGPVVASTVVAMQNAGDLEDAHHEFVRQFRMANPNASFFTTDEQPGYWVRFS